MCRKMNNKGLSMVELVIVIAILAVVGSLATLGLSVATSKPADECASKMVTLLNSSRMTTMGKESVQMSFYMQDDCVYAEEMVNGTVTNAVKIGVKGVQVKYRMEGETGFTNLGNATNKVTFSFKRSSGGFKELVVAGTSTGKYCAELQVSKGDRTKTITLAYLTGKVLSD